MEISWEDWQKAYDHLTLHIVPGPRSWTYFIPFFMAPAVLMLPPSKLPVMYIRTSVLPMLVSIQISDWVKNQSFDVISMNNVLMMFMLLGWYDVRKDFKRVVRRPGEHRYRLEPYPQGLISRARWIGLLLVSLRLTDWHIGMSNHDKRQPSPIKRFRPYLASTVLHAMSLCIVLAQTSSISICKSQSTWILPVRLYAILALYNSLLPTLIVLCIVRPLGLQENSLVSPLTWHDHFGPISSIYKKQHGFGIRAFWGIFWHQNMRYLTSTHGVSLASLFGMSGTARYITIVVASFFCSGIVHMGVIPQEPLHGSPLRLRLQLASFFWLQPFGIGLELLFESLTHWQQSGINEAGDNGGQNGVMRKVLILFWTFGFLAVTANLTIRPVGCRMGWWSSPYLSPERLI